MMVKKALKKFVWEKEEYFISARKAILAGFSWHAGLKRLKECSLKAFKILDCGSGDGTTIEMIWNPKAEFWGVDISKEAVKTGREGLKDKKNIHLEVGDIEKLSFPDEEFDLVYSAHTLEHLDNPEKVIKEMIRVNKKGGLLVLISPNFGSPLYPSPCSPPEGETLTSRAIKIFFKSHLYLFKKPKGLDWFSVYPKALREKGWQSDWDAVVEPYLQTLLIFLENNQMKVVESYSTLQAVAGRVELVLGDKPSLKQKSLLAFRKFALFLEKKGISPYKYYGPSLIVVAKKR